MMSEAFWERAIEISVGSLSPTINWSSLAKQEFLLPPKDQQAQIAELLWAMDDVIEKRQRIVDGTNILIKIALIELVKNKKKSIFKPAYYEDIALEDLVIKEKSGLKRGPFGSSLRKEYFTNKGIRVYEQGNVISNDFLQGNYFIDETIFEKMKSFEVLPSDILVSCSGTIGKVSIVPVDIEKGIMNQALLRIRLNEDIVFPKYFKYLFESELMQSKLLQKIQGSAMKNLVEMKVMRKIKFPIIDKATQEIIINLVDSKILVNDLAVKSSKSLQKSLINQVF